MFSDHESLLNGHNNYEPVFFFIACNTIFLNLNVCTYVHWEYICMAQNIVFVRLFEGTNILRFTKLLKLFKMLLTKRLE
jgi:hypothetical protein